MHIHEFFVLWVCVQKTFKWKASNFVFFSHTVQMAKTSQFLGKWLLLKFGWKHFLISHYNTTKQSPTRNDSLSQRDYLLFIKNRTRCSMIIYGNYHYSKISVWSCKSHYEWTLSHLPKKSAISWNTDICTEIQASFQDNFPRLISDWLFVKTGDPVDSGWFRPPESTKFCLNQPESNVYIITID